MKSKESVFFLPVRILSKSDDPKKYERSKLESISTL